jgi:hypothetical protein
MQAIMKPQIVKLTSTTAQTTAVQQNLKASPATQHKTGRSFLDCLLAALSGWPV